MEEMRLATMPDQDNYNSNQCFLQLKNLKKNFGYEKGKPEKLKMN